MDISILFTIFFSYLIYSYLTEVTENISPGTIQQMQSTGVQDIYLTGMPSYPPMWSYWNAPTRDIYPFPYPYPGYNGIYNPFIYDYMYY